MNVILAGIHYACLHRVQIACTNAGPDKMRSCFYVLVSGTLLLSQRPLIGRTPKCVQMLSLHMRKHVQPSLHSMCASTVEPGVSIVLLPF